MAIQFESLISSSLFQHKSRNIKMIFFDLDGTVLNSRKKVSQYTINALNKAATAGVQLIPATGRSIRALPEQLKSVQGITGVISLNGAVIVDCAPHRWIQRYPINNYMVVDLYNVSKKFKCSPTIVVDGFYFNDNGAKDFQDIQFPKSDFRWNMDKLIKENGLKNVMKQNICEIEKFVLMFSEADEKRKVLEELKSISGIEVSYAHSTTLEITASGVNKGNALKVLAERHHVPLNQTMAIGDNNNDLSMIRSAGWSIAMGNAYTELKKVADGITLDNDHDGVARAIEQILQL